MDSYRIPTKSGASEYVDKRSRFLGLVRPVGSEVSTPLLRILPALVKVSVVSSKPEVIGMEAFTNMSVVFLM